MRSDPRRRTSRVVGRMQAAETTMTVLLDPGHGGDDTGAVWQFQDGSLLFEKDVNLNVAKMAISEIAPYIDVRMTRTKDEFINLRERALVPYHYDLLVSIHCNAIEQKLWDKIQGTEVYVRSLSDKASHAIAKRLVVDVADALGITPNLPNAVRASNALRVLSLSWQILDRFGRSRSCLCLAEGCSKEDPRGALNQGTPAVLVELGYLTSERDRSSLMAKEGQMAAARAIAAVVNSLAAVPSEPEIPVRVDGDAPEEDAELLATKVEGKRRGRKKKAAQGINIDAIAEGVLGDDQEHSG